VFLGGHVFWRRQNSMRDDGGSTGIGVVLERSVASKGKHEEAILGPGQNGAKLNIPNEWR
jgi:pantoate kinase